jgi:chromosomal replication initiator protein
LIIDDVHLLVNKKKTQVEFLNTFSSLIDSGRQIVLASDLPPRALKDLDPGLVGRFLGGLVLGIRKPELETRLGIARLFAARLPVTLAGEVLQFVAEAVRATAREISGALSQLVHEVQVRGGEMTVERARAVLADCLHPAGRRIDIPGIAQVVAAHYELTTNDLISPNRQRHVARPRQVAMYLARRYTQRSLAEIGKFFGKRDHTTVKCAVRKIERLLAEAPGSLARDIESLRTKIEE